MVRPSTLESAKDWTPSGVLTMSDSENEKQRKRDKTAEFLRKNFIKGELALKHAIGLGQQPSVIPLAQPVLNGPTRPVEVGWHPVGGFAGKWFAEETGLGKMITEKINRYPDPTQHWAVLVGDYAHQLWMDENFHVIYINEKVNRDEWQTFPVGETRFNDDAIRRTGESVIQSIRDDKPAYNLITNNCQTYALHLLDAIKVGARKDFGTTLAVYERILGPGKIADLFTAPDGQQLLIEQGQPSPGSHDTVSVAQEVMKQNTTELDTHVEMGKHNAERGLADERGEKKSLFSRFTKSWR
ncbi:hypothetical protein HJFPF1_00307 [Paramyrothecium foliicola]|nr:hypothetical protein HJFPF1_00307 [Paramyrothecium foliicola]